jgi:hypothetical protein
MVKAHFTWTHHDVERRINAFGNSRRLDRELVLVRVDARRFLQLRGGACEIILVSPRVMPQYADTV